MTDDTLTPAPAAVTAARQSGFRAALIELRDRLVDNTTAETDALVDEFLSDYGMGLRIENERWRR